MTFQVGDEVEILHDSDYAITTKGSRGIIIEVLSQHTVAVKFTELPFYHEYRGHTFDIAIKNLMFLNASSLEERVCKKAKLIHSRQVKRGIIHA